MKLGKVNFLQSYNYGRLNRPLWITLFNIRSIHESETVSFVVYLIKVDAFPYVSNSAMSKPFRSIRRILGWYVQNHDNIENNIFFISIFIKYHKHQWKTYVHFCKKKCTKTFSKQNRRMIHEYIQRIDENVEMYNCISIEFIGII